MLEALSFYIAGTKDFLSQWRNERRICYASKWICRNIFMQSSVLFRRASVPATREQHKLTIPSWILIVHSPINRLRRMFSHDRLHRFCNCNLILKSLVCIISTDSLNQIKNDFVVITFVWFGFNRGIVDFRVFDLYDVSM